MNSIPVRLRAVGFTEYGELVEQEQRIVLHVHTAEDWAHTAAEGRDCESQVAAQTVVE